jgi:hypothetical protein
MKELIAIQQELKAPKTQFNSFGKYNYRNCEDILEAVKPLLKKQKCCLTLQDTTQEIAGIPVITACATIKNDAGEIVQVTAQAGVDLNRKGMDISQSFGASSSYARKYCLGGLFLLDDTKDADATNTHGKEKAAPDKRTDDDIAKQFDDCMTLEDLKALWGSLSATQKKEFEGLKNRTKENISEGPF